MAATRNDIEQLRTPMGERLLATIREAQPTPATAIRVATRLRREYSPDLVAAAMALHDLRVRARAKFAHADQMWFTRDGLEQATSESIAMHRADRFSDCERIADLCCGIGGDLLALASHAPAATIIAVDRDLVHLRMAELNVQVVGVRDRVTFIEADVRAFEPHDAALFIDPARRSGTGRAKHGDSEPPLEWCVAQAAGGRPVGVKFAPGIDHDRIPVDWELETIALGFDLKEAALWSPALARAERTATVMDGDAASSLHAVPGDAPPVRTPEPGDTLLDPNPAVTRAGLVADLARSVGAAMIDPQIAFLVATDAVDTPFARALRVVASLPWHERDLKRVLRGLDAGPVDVRRRGLAGDVDAIAKRLRGIGDRRLTVAMTRVMDQPWAIVCKAPVGSAQS